MTLTDWRIVLAASFWGSIIRAAAVWRLQPRWPNAYHTGPPVIGEAHTLREDQLGIVVNLGRDSQEFVRICVAVV